MLRNFNCDACGKLQQTYRRDTRFCSDKCKMRYHRKQKRINEVNANVDLSVFIPSVTEVQTVTEVPSVTEITSVTEVQGVTEQNSITKNDRPGILGFANRSKIVKGTMEGWNACRHHAVCWCDECLKLFLNVEGNVDGGYRRVKYIDGNSPPFAVRCNKPSFPKRIDIP